MRKWKPNSRIWKKFQNRVIRIVPVYWAFTLIMVGLVLALPQAFDTARFDIWQILRSFLFLPGPTAEVGRPILSLGWTLNLEMYFYGLFAIALAVAGRRAVPLLSAVLVLTVALHPLLARVAYPLEFWSQPIILNFAAGMGLGALHLRGAAWSRRGGLAALAGSLLVFVLLPALDLDWMGPMPSCPSRRRPRSSWRRWSCRRTSPPPARPPGPR